MNWAEEYSVPLWGATLAALTVAALRALWLLHEARHERRMRERRHAGRITGQTGPGVLAWGGVIQRRHPTECADCGDLYRNLDGSCWSCSGRRRQPKGVHRETAA